MSKKTKTKTNKTKKTGRNFDLRINSSFQLSTQITKLKQNQTLFRRR